VFGIFGHPDAAAITALGLHALRIAARTAAGISFLHDLRELHPVFHQRATARPRRLHFSLPAPVIDRLPGTSAVGLCPAIPRPGETILRNVQPMFAELNAGGFAVGHNGNLTNGLTLAPRNWCATAP